VTLVGRMIAWLRGPPTALCPRCLLPLASALRNGAVLEREAARAQRANEDILCCAGDETTCQLAEIRAPYHDE
jgi:hypothetical protein